ncbi:DUF1453 family protein [Sciscionella sediminilitoris]|uniref:DUF1453 family protein n=1 Tax=Sciscionella sediminilitoris TaxID=1445613 RepID=UPI0004DFAD20|nr:DUF1453 family protein [Sciscionella sp. SE31]
MNSELLDIVLGLVVVALVVLMIVRRTRGVPVSARRLLIVPLVLLVVGVQQISGDLHVMSRLDWLLALAFAVVSLGAGVLRGVLSRLYEQEGRAWMRYTWVTVCVWLALIPLRVGMVVLANVFGASVAGGTHLMFLLLALTFGGEALVVFPRARARGLVIAASPVRA